MLSCFSLVDDQWLRYGRRKAIGYEKLDLLGYPVHELLTDRYSSKQLGKLAGNGVNYLNLGSVFLASWIAFPWAHP